MSDNPILGFSVMNRLAVRVTLLGDANIVQKNVIFHTFHATRTVGRRFYTVRRQALEFWALGTTKFSSLRSFNKLRFLIR